MKDLPQFFKDDSKTDKYEEVIDYFMSWTIRCADDKYKSIELVNKYSKMILSKLVFDDENELNDKVVTNVKAWKQSGRIDLWIEFEIKNPPKKIALIIENKMYSNIRENQLESYRKNVQDYYKDKKEFDIKFVLLRPDHTRDEEKGFCLKEGFLHYNLDQLQLLLPKQKTGNDLFDEFWHNW